nr:hypothetical protein [Dickeya zeae]
MNRKSLIQPGSSLVDTLVTPVEKSVNLLQKFGGRRVMPWFFIAPNMLLFAVFVFIPILLAVCYAFTGGDQYPAVGPSLRRVAELFHPVEL